MGLTLEASYYLIPLILLCVMIATGAWRKSISTLIISLLIVLGGALFHFYGTKGFVFSTLFGQTLLLARAIINHEKDRLFK